MYIYVHIHIYIHTHMHSYARGQKHILSHEVTYTCIDMNVHVYMSQNMFVTIALLHSLVAEMCNSKTGLCTSVALLGSLAVQFVQLSNTSLHKDVFYELVQAMHV